MQVSKITSKLSAAMLLTLALGGWCLAQAPTAASRQEVENTIRAQAKQDASRGKQRDAGPLIEMFGGAAAAAGLAPNEIVNVYEKEYFEAVGAQPWWESVSPQWGWLAAAIMFALLVFRDVLKDTLKNAVTVTKDWVYKRISGYRLFRRTALRHYRQALTRRYHLLKIPFQSDHPLNLRDIYVPLKVKGASDAEQVDAFRIMAVTQKMMIVGPPGSGKSMLLKHVALSYADGKFTHLPDRPIPIILELNRLNESSKTIEEHLVDSLDIDDFHNARNFVDMGLEGGTLMLLFDGLDEVNSSRRGAVVKTISDLLHKYPTCRAIVTCRTAVYRNEFTEVTDQTLEIVEFTDQQVQKFLSAWHPYIPAGKSIEQLVNTLQARPRIMALARNPLLLTIIAFLYTAPNFVLPDSRTEFYKQAIDVLLRQWNALGNQFNPQRKSMVLQHLAVFNQESDAERSQDRRSIDFQTVIEQIKKVLPTLGLELKDADLLLGEIVERSGLLLQIDGGARYQFAHLTLQEYFAATALSTDEQGLLKRFLQDPDAWRETVKLWCGLEQDSTALVGRIFEHDPITAFECLADAQKISPELAERIINHFKRRLATDRETDEAVVRAFAAVASGQSPRSQAMFGYLTDKLESLSTAEAALLPSPLRNAVVMSLALTNNPAAVIELLRFYDLLPEVRAAVVKMGDLAVKGLAELCELRFENWSYDKRAYAIQGLRDISTPKAAGVLVPILWQHETPYEMLAARALSSLFGQPLILDTLRQYPLTAWQKSSPEYSSVWTPFTEDAETSLPIIAARCAELMQRLARVPEMEEYFHGLGLDMGKADLRLVMPTIIKDEDFIQLRAKLRKEPVDFGIVISRATVAELTPDQGLEPEHWLQDFSRRIRYEGRLKAGERLPSATQFIPYYVDSVFISTKDKDSSTYRLLSLLRPQEQLKALSRLFTRPRPTLRDWTRISESGEYSFGESWQYRATLVSVGVLCLISVFGAGESLANDRSPWALVSAMLFAVTAGVAAHITFREGSDAEALIIVVTGAISIPLSLLEAIEDMRGDQSGGIGREEYWLFPFIVLFPVLSAYFVFQGVSGFAGRNVALVALGCLIALVALFISWGKWRERRRRNPLRGLLDDDDFA
jgi:hypothetical protein